MNLYQHYEFIAVDQALSPADLATLRTDTAASSTSTSCSYSVHNNETIDTLDWMRRGFDVAIRLGHQGQRQLVLRLPQTLLRTLDAAYGGLHPGVEEQNNDGGEHSVVHWTRHQPEPLTHKEPLQPQTWMARLLPLRDELLRGDLRPFYLAWLAQVAAGKVSPEAWEPTVPAGLSRLSGAQQTLVEFLALDADVLAAAISTDNVTGASPVSTQRQVATLRAEASALAQRRQLRAADQRARQEAEQHRQRTAYLQHLALDLDAGWEAIHQQAACATAQAYDQAQSSLTDLAEAYLLTSDRKSFNSAMRVFMLPHSKRGPLVRRLVAAGLWRK